jgi:hypothetical protein
LFPPPLSGTRLCKTEIVLFAWFSHPGPAAASCSAAAGFIGREDSIVTDEVIVADSIVTDEVIVVLHFLIVAGGLHIAVAPAEFGGDTTGATSISARDPRVSITA